MILSRFIVFEGIDGSGTSTQVRLLAQRIARSAPSCALSVTAEPTSAETGRFLRQILKGTHKVHPGTAAHLFAADRHEHLYGTDGIITHIERGGTVISDRYLFSSLAYQSIECGEELPYRLNSSFPLPQLLFFFDIDPQTAMSRIARRSSTEIYETLPFLEKTAAAYRRVIAGFEQDGAHGMRIVRIPAAEPIAEIASKIWNTVQELPILKT